MAIEKTGYKTLNTATTSVKVGVDLNGNIATSDDQAADSKRISITGVNIDNTLESNTSVLQVFITHFCGGAYLDETTNKMIATWEV